MPAVHGVNLGGGHLRTWRGGAHEQERLERLEAMRRPLLRRRRGPPRIGLQPSPSSTDPVTPAQARCLLESEVAVQPPPRGFCGACRTDRPMKNTAKKTTTTEASRPHSLEEGLDETIAVKRLRLFQEVRTPALDDERDREPHGLRVSLVARVKRWCDGRMILRWAVAAVADAATRLRKVAGAGEGMIALMRTLARHESSTVAASKAKAA